MTFIGYNKKNHNKETFFINKTQSVIKKFNKNSGKFK